MNVFNNIFIVRTNKSILVQVIYQTMFQLNPFLNLLSYIIKCTTKLIKLNGVIVFGRKTILMQRRNIVYNIDVHSKRINVITTVEKITTRNKK